MENALAVAGGLPAAGSLAPAPLKAWTMGKPSPKSGETDRDQRSAVEVLVETDLETQLVSAFTLRVKPDRRRVQLPIPPGLDRRRPQS
jgi:hypothetical protein